MPSPLLARVGRASGSRRRAEEEYRAALLAALEAGCSFAEVARAASVSRQAVRQMAKRVST